MGRMGRMGRMGPDPVRFLFAGRVGSGAPGRVDAFGLAVGIAGAERTVMGGFGTAGGGGVRPGIAGAGVPIRVGIDDTGTLGGSLGLGGCPGTMLVAGRATSGPNSATDGISGLKSPASIRSAAGITSFGLGFDTAGAVFATGGDTGRRWPRGTGFGLGSRRLDG